MLKNAGYAFLLLGLFCLVVGTSSIAPFVVGIALIAYHNWRDAGYQKVGKRNL